MALLTDGRFSGATRGLMIGHVAPEAAINGPIAQVRENDQITIDIPNRRLDLNVPAPQLQARRETWTPPAPNYSRGIFAKYAAQVSGAEQGAVTS